MTRCSVCQTRYTTQKTERCPQCGWDVQALSFISGMIPEVAQKEAARLEWAKQLWSRAKQTQDRATQLQIQLEIISDREKALQAQLNQQKTEFTQLLKQHEATIAALKAELSQPSEPVEIHEVRPVVQNPPPAPPPEHRFAEPASSAILIAAPPVSLKPFDFESIVIQAEGRKIEQHQALYFEEILDDSIRLEMVSIPAGRFQMGSPETECGRDLHESPQHWVNVAPFAIGRFLITQAQWKAIAALPKIKRALNLYPSDFEGDDRPVEQVSWHDALEFCDRLTQKTGRSYRLPSEAEWEYACRAGTTTPFHFGETIASDLANYDANYVYGAGTTGMYRQTTSSKLSIANAFGLSDMHGNLWEWCADAWHDTYHGAPDNGQVWEADDEVTYRVLRGGAWYCLPELCRSAQRHWNQPNMAGSGIGFRVVCNL